MKSTLKCGRLPRIGVYCQKSSFSFLQAFLPQFYNSISNLPLLCAQTAGLPETVACASAGALAHLPVARVTNLSRAMEEMKEAGYWLVGFDERAEQRHTEVDFKVPVGIVLGGEGKGLHALVRERCDFLVSIPTTGPVRALNVSVAAGVVLFEVVRQRRLKETTTQI